MVGNDLKRIGYISEQSIRANTIELYYKGNSLERLKCNLIACEHCDVRGTRVLQAKKGQMNNFKVLSHGGLELRC